MEAPDPPDQIVIVGASEHNLKDVDLALPRNALTVFTGVSGSGKSSALRFLCDQHPAFSGEPQQWIWVPGKSPDPAQLRGNRLVVVDEVSHPRQLPLVARLLKQNQAVAVASHLKPAWFLPLQLAWKIHHFRTQSFYYHL